MFIEERKLSRRLKMVRTLQEKIDLIKNFDTSKIDYNNLDIATKPQAYLYYFFSKICETNNWKIVANINDLYSEKSRSYRSDIYIDTGELRFCIAYDGLNHNNPKQKIYDLDKDAILYTKRIFSIHVKNPYVKPLNNGSFEVFTCEDDIIDSDCLFKVLDFITGTLKTSIKFKQKDFILPKNIDDVIVSREDIFLYKLALYAKYVKENNSIYVPYNLNYHGCNLGTWIQSVRVKYRENKLNDFYQLVLEEIGFTTDEYLSKCEEGYEYAKEYYNEFGNLDISINFIYKGYNLGKWVYSYRQRYLNPDDPHLRAISDKEKEKLDQIGFVWNKKPNINTKIKLIEELKIKGFDFNVNQSTSDNKDYLLCLRWINKIRIHPENVDKEIIDKLTSMNICLDKLHVNTRTKLLKIKSEVLNKGYIVWNSDEFDGYKKFIKVECNKALNDNSYSKELLDLIKGCGIDPYSEKIFSKTDNYYRDLAYAKQVPARIFYCFCENKRKYKDSFETKKVH